MWATLPAHVAIWDDASRTNFIAWFALDSTLAGLAAEGRRFNLRPRRWC